MNPLSNLLNEAQQPGATIRTFCSWCPNESSGELAMIDGDLEINLPVCEDCVRVIAEKHRQKMDGLDQLADG